MLTIYDPIQDDSLGKVRGSGRFVKILRENLADTARFVTDLKQVSPADTLFIPLWYPFQKPYLAHALARRHVLMLFDVIPLKYPEHFPIGLKGRWWLVHNLRSLALYDKIVTISEAAKVDIIEHLNVSPEIIDVVHLTTSKTLFASSRALSKKSVLHTWHIPSSIYCIYVGDTNWNKNLVTLAQAAIQANMRIVCVGKSFAVINELRGMDSEAQHEYLATSETLNHHEQLEFKDFIKLVLHDERFVFPGYVPDEDLRHLYARALCNILVSRDEGFGLSYLEAARQHCPSILADIPVFHEIAGNGAFFVDPERPSDLAEQIKTLQKKPRSYVVMKTKVFVRSKKFSPEIFAREIAKALSSATARV